MKQQRPVSITSETGRLRSVLVHCPGAEVELMVPAMMTGLLFDDILFAERAQREHDQLRRVLGLVADEVLCLGQLLSESLAETATRSAVMSRIGEQLGLSAAARLALSDKDQAQMCHSLIAGSIRPGVAQVPGRVRDIYHLPPLPNLMFMRDPAIAIGDGLVLSSMGTQARLREPLVLGTIFRHHPRFSDVVPILYDRFEPEFGGRSTARPRPSIEGGDILVAREDLLLVGASMRTRRRTIEELAVALMAANSGVRTIVVIELPAVRSYMHLDTVFTLINKNECLVYPPVILDGGVEQAAVYQLDLANGEISATNKPSLLNTLAQLGLALEPVLCGGDGDPIAQQREQWTDGANAFALAPGVILLFERNVKTARALEHAGYRLVSAPALLDSTNKEDLSGNQRLAILLDGSELSRARGGPRCLTMPLQRDPLPD